MKIFQSWSSGLEDQGIFSTINNSFYLIIIVLRITLKNDDTLQIFFSVNQKRENKDIRRNAFYAKQRSLHAAYTTPAGCCPGQTGFFHAALFWFIIIIIF